MDTPLYPHASRETAQKRRQLAPKTLEAFKAFSDQVFADGALPRKTKELIGLALSIADGCHG